MRTDTKDTLTNAYSESSINSPESQNNRKEKRRNQDHQRSGNSLSVPPSHHSNDRDIKSHTIDCCKPTSCRRDILPHSLRRSSSIIVLLLLAHAVPALRVLHSTPQSNMWQLAVRRNSQATFCHSLTQTIRCDPFFINVHGIDTKTTAGTLSEPRLPTLNNRPHDGRHAPCLIRVTIPASAVRATALPTNNICIRLHNTIKQLTTSKIA